jgi:hypothetical protein
MTAGRRALFGAVFLGLPVPVFGPASRFKSLNLLNLVHLCGCMGQIFVCRLST